MKLTLVAAASLAGVLAIPTHASAGARTITVAAPHRRDLTVQQLSVASRTKPALKLTGAVHGVAAYGAVTPAGSGRWTVRIVVIRTRSAASAVSLKLSASTVWRSADVLHNSTIVPQSGLDPTVTCAAFGVGFVHLGGDRVPAPLRTVGTDACLLAAHAVGLTHGLLVTVPSGFQQPYFPVTVGPGVQASASGFVRAGTSVMFMAPGLSGWTGACSGPGPCTVVVRGPVTVGATFLPVAASPTPPPSPPSSPAALTNRTGAYLTEYAINLSHPTVAAGSVQIVGHDGGMDAHQLAIRDSSGHVLGATRDIAVGAEVNLSVSLTSGTYTVFCPLPTHEMRGMSAVLTVQ